MSRTILSKQFWYERDFLLSCGNDFFSVFSVQTKVMKFWLYEQWRFGYQCCNILIIELNFRSAETFLKELRGRYPGLVQTTRRSVFEIEMFFDKIWKLSVF